MLESSSSSVGLVCAFVRYVNSECCLNLEPPRTAKARARVFVEAKRAGEQGRGRLLINWNLGFIISNRDHRFSVFFEVVAIASGF